MDCNSRPVQGVPVFHPDVTVWEVTDADGKHVGLWYLDPYAREGQAEWRLDDRLSSPGRHGNDRSRPSFPTIPTSSKVPKGEPVLISWDDAVTLFHEFGHALHGLLSKVQLPVAIGHERRAGLR